MEGRDGEAKIRFYKNHLLFEFKVRTVSYRPSFFRTDLLPEREAFPSGKKRGSVTYRVEQEKEVSKIFIISLSLNGGRGRVQFRKTFEFS